MNEELQYDLTEGKWKRRKKKKKTTLSQGKRDLIDKLVANHKKRKEKTAAEKRADKIADLQNRKNSWKNLE